MRWRGDSLSTRITVIILAGLGVVLLLASGLVIVPILRGQSSAFDMPLPRETLRIAELLERTSPEEQARIMEVVNTSLVRAYVMADFPPSGRQAVGPPSGPLGSVFKSYADALSDREFRIDVQTDFWRRYVRSGKAVGWPVRLSVRLHDGRVLVVERKPSGVIRTFFIRAMLLLFGVVGVLLVALLLAVRETTRPVARLAEAVRLFANKMDAADLPPAGPRELRELSADFNEMKQRIRDLVDQRTRMLAAVAHDMRTYMTRLRLRCEFIDDPTQKQKAQNDIEEMARLLDDTLLFARVSSGPSRIERIDIARTIDLLIEEQGWSRQEVRLTTGAPTPFLGSRQAIERIVVNLIDNAIRYGAPPVEITVETVGDEIEIRVMDHGPGIPPDKLETVLDPFERLEPSRARDSGGAGLGLAIVHALAGAQGGGFALANWAEGGLLARVRLPVGEPALTTARKRSVLPSKLKP